MFLEKDLEIKLTLKKQKVQKCLEIKNRISSKVGICHKVLKLEKRRSL